MKNILLAVTGLTPQILTETLYYYTVVANPPVAFDEIMVITTATGKRRILDNLLAPEAGFYHQLCKDYGVSGIRFDESCIVTIGGSRPVEDIRSVADNGIMAAQILGVVKKLTADPTTALYCSIAGGRKTMGAYLALALQLYGRTQDKLSHVLVTPEFESLPDFFYPPPEDRIVQGRAASGRSLTLHTRNAKIDLADIPFVSLRSSLPARGNFPVAELVRKLQASVEGAKHQTSLRISLRQKRIWVSNVAISLPPKELAFYSFFADAKRKCGKKKCGACSECFLGINELTAPETGAKILGRHRTIAGRYSGHLERTEAAWKRSPPDENHFLGAISKINRALRRNADERDYPLVEISHVGTYGNKRYGIALDKRHIEL